MYAVLSWLLVPSNRDHFQYTDKLRHLSSSAHNTFEVYMRWRLGSGFGRIYILHGWSSMSDARVVAEYYPKLGNSHTDNAELKISSESYTELVSCIKNAAPRRSSKSQTNAIANAAENRSYTPSLPQACKLVTSLSVSPHISLLSCSTALIATATSSNLATTSNTPPLTL